MTSTNTSEFVVTVGDGCGLPEEPTDADMNRVLMSIWPFYYTSQYARTCTTASFQSFNFDFADSAG